MEEIIDCVDYIDTVLLPEWVRKKKSGEYLLCNTLDLHLKLDAVSTVKFV